VVVDVRLDPAQRDDRVHQTDIRTLGGLQRLEVGIRVHFVELGKVAKVELNRNIVILRVMC
jgi:hypothetical protein